MLRRELELDIVEKLIKLTERGDILWERNDGDILENNVIFQTEYDSWVLEIRSRRREIFIEGREHQFLSFCIRNQGKNRKLVRTIRDKRSREEDFEVVENEKEFMDDVIEKLENALEE